MFGRILLIAVAVVLTIPACGGSNDATTTPRSPTISPAPTVAGDRRVEVLDSGFSATNGTISAAFLAHNYDATEAVTIDMQIDFLDSSGASVGSSFGTVIILPGSTLGKAFAGTYTPADADVVTVDVEPALASARWSSFRSPDRLTATVISSSAGRVRGTLANPFINPTGPLWMNVVAFDATGKIVDGTSVAQPPVAARSSAEFEISLPAATNLTVARVEAYPEFQQLIALEAPH